MRFPWTLWVSYTTDLLRLLTLTAGVLVTVIAFAGAIKPISDGLLSSADALRFVLLAIPPMLAYALPFAGGFAATLVYHRIANDLEATAAYAGGLSHRAVLAPAFAVALGCATLLTALNEVVIPRFLLEMQRLITVDVARLVAQQVSRGQSVSFGDVMIHADRVQNVRPEGGVLDALLLTGFAAIELRDGAPTTEVTAARATLWLLPGEAPDASMPTSRDDEGRTRVVLELTDVVAAREAGGIGVFSDTRVSWVVPNTFRDNVKFLSWQDLARIRDTPERLNWIDPKRKALALSLARQLALRDVLGSLAPGGAHAFTDDRGARVTIRAGGATREGDRITLAPLNSTGVEVTTQRPGDAPQTIRAAGGRLDFEDQRDALDPRVRFRLVLDRARPSGDSGPERATLALTALEPDASTLRDLLALGSRDLLDRARALADGPDADPDVREKFYGVHGLAGALRRLDHDVLAKRNERLALAASCAVMVLCGAVMALRLASRSPLLVYLFSFFPALAALVTISGGQQVTVKQGAPGLFLMWSGVGGLALFTLFVYRRLARH
jgi:lipopolysaccharide export LptBFGC system permease protein LptF